MLARSACIDKNSPVPAYHQIAADVIERISAGEWEIDDKLPSESSLAEEYGVSRVTLRQAMADLEKRGLIQKFQGKGVFLSASPKPFVEDLNFPTIKRLAQPANRNEARVLELRLEQAPSAVACETMGFPRGVPMVYLSRLFLRKGVPIGLNQVWFPPQLVPGLVEQGLVNASISETLSSRYGFHITHIENYIEAGKLNAGEAALLNAPYDASILKIQSTHSLAGGEIVEYSSTVWLGALTRFHYIVDEAREQP